MPKNKLSGNNKHINNTNKIENKLNNNINIENIKNNIINENSLNDIYNNCYDDKDIITNKDTTDIEDITNKDIITKKNDITNKDEISQYNNNDNNSINKIIINDLSINNNFSIIKNMDELKELYSHLNFIDKFNNTNYNNISKNLLDLYYNPNSFLKLMDITLNNFENNGNIQLFNNNEILNATIQNIKLLYKPFIINQCYLYIYYYNILIPYVNEHMSINIIRIIDLNITKIIFNKEKIDHLYQKQKNILSNYNIHIDNIL